MKYEFVYPVSIERVDSDKVLPLGRIAEIIQNGAKDHFDKYGMVLSDMMETGVIWLLGKVEIEFLNNAHFKDNLYVSTWHKRIERFYGLRDFIVKSEEKKEIFKAQSLWLYYDFKNKKLDFPKNEDFPRLEREDENLFVSCISKWKPKTKIDIDKPISYTLRKSDFDIMGHMNNLVYYNLLDDYVSKLSINYSNLKLQFIKEVPTNITTLTLGSKREGNLLYFNLYSDENLHCAGELTLK